MAKDKDRDKKSKRRKEKKSKSKHKSHKHKKHKAEKDENRASVSPSSRPSSPSSASSSSDTASHSSSSLADEFQLATLLSQACLQFPQLIEEFPALLQALDADQGIQLDQLQNAAIRSMLEEIFLHLPLEVVDEDGVTEFYKSSAVDSLASWLSAHLLARRVVATAETMSTPQLLATQAAMQAQQLLKEFPEIQDDMITVLDTIHQGSFVQIDSLENERVKELLAELFQALSLDYQAPKTGGERGDEDEDKADAAEGDMNLETGYGLKDMEGDASLALEYVLRTLTIARESQTTTTPSVPESEDDAEPQKPAVVGPAMPTREQLAEAQAAAASYMQKYHAGPEAGGDDEEDEDDFGPSMATPAQKAAAQKAAAASDAGPELLGMVGAAMPSIEPTTTTTTTTAPHPMATPAGGHVHEEWMMTPGDSKLLGGLKSTLPTTRTFQRGKLAKAAEEERKRKMPQVSEEEQRQMDEALAEHRAKRGKSLVELHQEQRRKQAARGFAKPKERRAFDREIDLGTRQMNEAQVRQLVAKAKDFDTRFSKSVQRTFL